MSATEAARELASPDSRRRPAAARPTVAARSCSSRAARSRSPRPPAGGTHRVPDPQPAPMPQLEQPTTPETWWESFQRAERARAGRLRSLWQMTPEQRVAAMRRGDLTYEQLAAWSARHPEQVPDCPRRVRMDRRQAPGGLRMTASLGTRRRASSTRPLHRAIPACPPLHRLDRRPRQPARGAPGRSRRPAATGDHPGRDRLDARSNVAGHARARTSAQASGRRLAAVPDLPRRARAQHDDRLPRDRRRPAATGARRARRRQLPEPTAAPRGCARSSSARWSVLARLPDEHGPWRQARPGGTRIVRIEPASMTTTAPDRAAADASARQLPADARRPGARRAAARDPLRAPPPRHGPPVHRRPQRARRRAAHPRLAVRTDVYVGVCLRNRRAGGRDAIDRSHLAFVEIDAAGRGRPAARLPASAHA